jgi:hypothetical protein
MTGYAPDVQAAGDEAGLVAAREAQDPEWPRLAVYDRYRTRGRTGGLPVSTPDDHAARLEAQYEDELAKAVAAAWAAGTRAEAEAEAAAGHARGIHLEE